MTFITYWYRKCVASPPLNEETNKMTITVAAFKSELKKAYEQGQKDASGTKAAPDFWHTLFGR